MEPVIKHFIETLNRENGGSMFEGLASTLAEKEICSNILPSTGPYGGGDKGTDLRTHKTYLLESGNNFRLYSSTEKSPTKGKIIFAFSIQKNWESKLDKDCKKIISKYKLTPNQICFITNQFIKTKEREEKIEELKKTYTGVDFEIFDGGWIVSKLKEKHYNILVRNFGFPETHDPKVEEMYQRVYSFRDGGMTDEESVKVKELLQRANYRVSYSGIIEQRVIDLKTVANIQVKYASFIEDSLKNYEEALTEINEVDDKLLVSELYYDYFKALQKLRMFNNIVEKLTEYRAYLIDNKLYRNYRFIFTWLMYLLPHQKEVSINLKDFAKETYDLIQKDPPKDVARHIVAYYKEALTYGEQMLTILEEREDDLIKKWHDHIKLHKDIPLYPIAEIARVVTVLAIHYEETEEYENLYSFVEDILVSRNQKFEAAQLRKDRGMNLFNAKKYDKAIRHFNIVKIQWYDYETFRGSLLSAWILHECYSSLGLLYAALQELYSILHMTTLDEETLSKHKDLFVRSLVFIYYKYLQLGLVGSALIIGKLALFAIAKYKEEPHLDDDNTKFSELFHKNTALTLVALKNKYGTYADKLLPIIERVDPENVTTYKMLFEETDEEFEKGWDGAEDKLVEAKKFRKEIKSGKFSKIGNNDIEQPVNESAQTQTRKFKYKDMECVVEFEKSFDNKRLAEHVLAYLQEIFVFFLEDIELTWIENQVLIHIIIDETVSNFQVHEKANNDKVEINLIVSTKVINELFTSSFNTLFELERSLFFYLLMECTIDKQEDIKNFLEKLQKKDFFESLSGRVPYGFTMNTFFPKEDYESITS